MAFPTLVPPALLGCNNYAAWSDGSHNPALVVEQKPQHGIL